MRAPPAVAGVFVGLLLAQAGGLELAQDAPGMSSWDESVRCASFHHISESAAVKGPVQPKQTQIFTD